MCRLLTLVSGLDPRLMGLFLVTPDIFDSLPESAGPAFGPTRWPCWVRSSPASPARPGSTTYGSFGRSDSNTVRASRSRSHGSSRWPLCRRRPHPVRGRLTVRGVPGTGRGLAGLMMSGTASDQFVSYDLGNT
ncbi:hypothetical protein BZL30_9180, partial [Mycobacterium kansasii]